MELEENFCSTSFAKDDWARSVRSAQETLINEVLTTLESENTIPTSELREAMDQAFASGPFEIAVHESGAE